MKNHRVAVFRKVTFNAAHRLYRKDWTNEQNKNCFGLCANENYHGHNYRLDVKVTGEIDPSTGYVIDIAELKMITDEEVMERFDHRNLNLDCPEFKDLNPTGENIVVVIYSLLRKRIDSKYDLQIRLYETDRNYFEYPA
ncbi:MAG: 6-carboxytetrahydropterin synthase [Chitinophagales bacterium]|nr:6-carboxytetrahydropterin synthase [Chitinophagales bacterium]